MIRALLIGVGAVGRQHLIALQRTAGVEVVGVADPRPLPPDVATGVRWFADPCQALTAMRPDLVVVACPPVASLAVARQAASTGALVLVEKPVVIDPGDLVCFGAADVDDRIAVAFQPHFAPGVADLLAAPPPIAAAQVRLAWRRDESYYRSWRSSWPTAGGVLHQQAIHGVALVLRLLGLPAPVTCVGQRHHHRRLSDAEDHVQADLTLTGETQLRLDCRVDHTGPPYHVVHLDFVDGHHLSITGRNLEAGLGPAHQAPTHHELRVAMYQALLATSSTGTVGVQSPSRHPCLFPLRELRPVLEVIDCVYRTVPRCRPIA